MNQASNSLHIFDSGLYSVGSQQSGFTVRLSLAFGYGIGGDAHCSIERLRRIKSIEELIYIHSSALLYILLGYRANESIRAECMGFIRVPGHFTVDIHDQSLLHCVGHCPVLRRGKIVAVEPVQEIAGMLSAVCRSPGVILVEEVRVHGFPSGFIFGGECVDGVGEADVLQQAVEW